MKLFHLIVKIFSQGWSCPPYMLSSSLWPYKLHLSFTGKQKRTSQWHRILKEEDCWNKRITAVSRRSVGILLVTKLGPYVIFLLKIKRLVMPKLFIQSLCFCSTWLLTLTFKHSLAPFSNLILFLFFFNLILLCSGPTTL